MTTLSTHVLDTATGSPGSGMEVRLMRWAGDGWVEAVTEMTDTDGRVSFGEVGAGRFRLAFETGAYGNEMYPYVHVVFEVSADRAHYHVPLLLSPYGYSTYRGS